MASGASSPFYFFYLTFPVVVCPLIVLTGFPDTFFIFPDDPTGPHNCNAYN